MRGELASTVVGGVEMIAVVVVVAVDVNGVDVETTFAAELTVEFVLVEAIVDDDNDVDDDIAVDASVVDVDDEVFAASSSCTGEPVFFTRRSDSFVSTALGDTAAVADTFVVDDDTAVDVDVIEGIEVVDDEDDELIILESVKTGGISGSGGGSVESIVVDALVVAMVVVVEFVNDVDAAITPFNTISLDLIENSCLNNSQ